jgi:hypothetical protein
MVSVQPLQINGLPLPDILVAAIGASLWVVPEDPARLRAAFPLEEADHPLFYGLDCMLRENATWPSVTESYYVGTWDADRPPGDIDPRKSVLIGDLGPDRPIALDYRTSRDNPSVAYLTGSLDCRWVQAASNIQQLMDLLGMARGGSSDSPDDARVECTLMRRQARQSPTITRISWGHMEVDGVGKGRDFKLYPGGGREWDWNETNTHHVPGIQPSDVRELVENGCKVVVLSRGMQLALQTCPETLQILQDNGIQVFVEETTAAVEIYNRLAGQHELVGGLFHSTC